MQYNHRRTDYVMTNSHFLSLSMSFSFFFLAHKIWKKLSNKRSHSITFVNSCCFTSPLTLWIKHFLPRLVSEYKTFIENICAIGFWLFFDHNIIKGNYIQLLDFFTSRYCLMFLICLTLSTPVTHEVTGGAPALVARPYLRQSVSLIGPDGETDFTPFPVVYIHSYSSLIPIWYLAVSGILKAWNLRVLVCIWES